MSKKQSAIEKKENYKMLAAITIRPTITPQDVPAVIARNYESSPGFFIMYREINKSMKAEPY